MLRNTKRGFGFGLSLLALSSSGQVALATTHAGLTAIDDARLVCLMNRVTPAPADPSAVASCFRLSAAQSSFMANMTDRLCNQPADFCRSLVAPPPGDGVTLRDLFVSPRCERGDPSGIAGSIGYSTATTPDDPRLNAMIRNAWGCAEPETRVLPAPVGEPRIVRSTSCDPALIPFDCTTGGLRGPNFYREGTGTDAEARNMMAEVGASISFGLTAAELGTNHRLSSGRCVLEAEDPLRPGSGASMLPPLEPAETTANYRARLTPPQLAHFQDMERRAIETSEHIYSASRELLGTQSTRFRLAARVTLSPENQALLSRSLRAAKNAMIAYLAGLNPPAPPAIRARIESAESFDYSLLFKANPTAAERRRLAQFEALCRTDHGTTAFGSYQAENRPHRHPHEGSQITVCPSVLLNAAAGNPNNLIPILLHELGHSIDPCTIGLTQTAVSMPGDSAACNTAPVPAIPSEEQEGVRAFIARINGPDGVVACMTSPLPGSAEPPVRQNSPEAMRAYRIALAQDGCLGNDTCSFKQFEPGGPLARCNPDLSGDRRVLRNCSRNRGAHALQALNALEPTPRPSSTAFPVPGQREQSPEAFADLIAAEALPLALQDPLLGETAIPPGSRQEERQAEILTSIPHFCHFSAPHPGDEHPEASVRIGLLSGSTSLRRALGCAPNSVERDAKHVAAGCMNRLSATPPSPAGGAGE